MSQKILYVVGAGPGSSDLLPVRAVKILQKSSLVFAAASSTRDYSTCLEIARPWLPENVRHVRLDFPMTADKTKMSLAWQKAAAICLSELSVHESGVFLTLGDPLIYSTFIYLYRTLKEMDPDLGVHIVPGITSFQAAAAICHLPLCEAGEGIRIVSGTCGKTRLEEALNSKDRVIILKVYRNYKEILEALRKSGRLGNAVLASQVEKPEEKIIWNLEDVSDQPHYMSLIIA